MNFAYQLAKLTHSSEVELFVLDAIALGATQLYRFAPMVNELGQPIVWQGQTYVPFPIEATGFEQRSDGPFPRPTLRVGNVLGSLGALVREYNKLKGAMLTRQKTMARYLDAVNFADGNDEADPTAEYPQEIWRIDHTNQRNKLIVEWQLGNPIDVDGVMTPGRQVQPNYCDRVTYRGPDCGYIGGPVAKADDTPTTDPAQDQCGKRLSSCKLRFSTGERLLPFAGFPGAGVLRQL